MSEKLERRALTRLASLGAVLARDRNGDDYGVFVGGDRRRRPIARLVSASVRRLASEGVIVACGRDVFELSDAGRMRLRRDAAEAEPQFLAQHVSVETRVVVDAEGGERVVRGVARSNVLRKLAALPGANGAAWLSAAELQAAQTLRSDWEASQAGVTRGSDWSAPPMGSGGRGVGNSQERVMAARCDRSRRVATALAALAPPLRRVVERVCFHEDGLELVERGEGWPARSAKLALKLALAQLAQQLAR